MAEDAADDPFRGILFQDLKDWARGKTLEQLIAVQSGVGSLFPEKLARWDFQKRAIVDVDVLVRLPGSFDLVRARVEALEALAKEAKRDASKFSEDDAAKLFGAGRWEAIERLYYLAKLIRKVEPPHAQYMLPGLLDENHAPQALEELDARIGALMGLRDRRVKIEDLLNNEPMFWAFLHSIAKVKNISPLVAIAGPDQETFLVFTAQRATELKAEVERLQEELETSRSKTSSER